MTHELIIGMDGFIGRNLCRHLPDALRTTRNSQLASAPSTHYFDMLKGGPLPQADVVYICAGINGAKTCALNPLGSYKTNVDGTIYIARLYRDTAFVVWISSLVVEWSVEKYAEQKRVTENYLRALPYTGIIRAGRVLQNNVDDLCRLMINVGRENRRGIFLWNEDENPYQR